MTYIEFFDKNAVENVCACLADAPERVILIGDKGKLMKKHAQRYREVFLERDCDIEFICRTVNRHELSNIVTVLTDIIETYGDCAIDLTGGEELYLVAVGMIFERYRDKNIQMHRFNLRNNTVRDCDGDGNTIVDYGMPMLSVRENIRIYGGDVIYDFDVPGTTLSWSPDKYLKKDVNNAWNICKDDVRLWNSQINVLAAAELYAEDMEDPLVTVASVDRVTKYLTSNKKKFMFVNGIFSRLRECGLISEYFCDSSIISITYKNEQVKRFLTKAGLVLELKIYCTAFDLEDEKGYPYYYDVMNGVTIDWDGVIDNDEDYDTQNEIDVILMKGTVPVFISCKNGSVTMEELYKLNSVADRFGGKYAKKVLVASALGEMDPFEGFFRQRAADMGIRIIDDVSLLSDPQLEDVIKSLWQS